LATTGKNIKILLMEDDIDLGETIQEMLELEGYSVILVKDGVEASQVSYNTRFDLYIFFGFPISVKRHNIISKIVISF
jgi:CheY-like chemotaxis protein